MHQKHKALSGLKITDASEGKVRAVFATLGVKDSDGDVTLAGAFTKENVRISAYNHQSWKGALPVGKGVIVEDGDEVILEGEFFLNTEKGRETFEVVKQMGDLQEWSYGYDVLDAERGTKDGERVNFLKEMKVHEVSPVILGAGVDTRTLAVKGAKQLQSNLRERLYEVGEERFAVPYRTYVWVQDFDEAEGYVVFGVETGSDYDSIRVAFTTDDNGLVTLAEEEEEVICTTTYTPKGAELQFKSHIDAVVTAVDEVYDRAADVMAKRAEKGKGLGAESNDSLSGLATRVAERQKELVSSPPPVNDPVAPDLTHEYLRSVQASLNS